MVAPETPWLRKLWVGVFVLQLKLSVPAHRYFGLGGIIRWRPALPVLSISRRRSCRCSLIALERLSSSRTAISACEHNRPAAGIAKALMGSPLEGKERQSLYASS